MLCANNTTISKVRKLQKFGSSLPSGKNSVVPDTAQCFKFRPCSAKASISAQALVCCLQPVKKKQFWILITIYGLRLEPFFCQQIDFFEPKCVHQKQIEGLQCDRDTNRLFWSWAPKHSTIQTWSNLISTFEV